MSIMKKTSLFGGALFAAGVAAGVHGQCSVESGDTLRAETPFSYDFIGANTFRQATFSGNKLYAVQELFYGVGAYPNTSYISENTLQIWDASNPQNLVLESESLPSEDRFFSSPTTEIFIIGDVMCGSDSGNLSIFDISQPVPTQINTLDLPGGIADIWEENGLLYIYSLFPSSLDVVDLSNPFSPQILGSWTPPLPSFQFRFGPVVGGRMPFIDRPGASWRMNMLDVSDPTNIQVLGTTETGNNTNAEPVLVGNAVVYPGPFAGQMQVFDFTDELNPVQLPTTSTPNGESITSMQGSVGLFLHMTTSNNMIYAMDFSDPTAPFIVDSLNESISSREYVYGPGLLSAREIDPRDGEIEVIEFTSCSLPPIVVNSPVSRLVDASPTPQELTITAMAATEYQWFKDGVALSDGGDYAGTQLPTLSVIPNGATEGIYTCTVSNIDGSSASGPGFLGVRAAASCAGDANGSGNVDFDDLNLVLSNWNTACAP